MQDIVGLILGSVFVVGFAAMIRRGFQDGDRAGDAVARVRIVDEPSPEGGVLRAEVTVDNQNDSPVLASMKARPASLARLALGEPVSRRAGTPGSRSIAGLELLGAVDGREQRTWFVPLEAAERPVVRITLVIYQVETRIRIVTFTCRIPTPHHDVARPRQQAGSTRTS